MQIHVIGLGVNELANLDAKAQSAFASLGEQDVILGSPRQHQTVANYIQGGQVNLLPKLSQLSAEFDQWQSQGANKVIVLASGDPLFFGIGSWLVKQFGASNVTFYPNVSSVQVACHRLAISLQDAQVVSLHGRPLPSLRRYLQANKKLILLTDGQSHPAAIAQECVMAGLDKTKVTVCEALGYPHENITAFDAAELSQSQQEFDPLNVVALETSSQASLYPSSVGIADELFVTDKGEGKGMITKREVRLMILSYMQLAAKEVVWDIGAGCGGVSVELAYWHPDADIYAVEHHEGRWECLQANQQKFGVMQNLHLIKGRAPEVLDDLPKPNKVFIGGSDGALVQLMAQTWSLLPIGGILLVSAVTEDTRLQVATFANQRKQAQDTIETSLQIAISKAELLAGQTLYRPNLPVTLYQFIKQHDAETV
ncbi:bifunctional cobalt-precorrin-7 (C(5))-methyltransferase/cobalt-precorrin-6B (C(15))-methyltransferase [Marinomonas posidonica]|uniref:tRNA (guanine(46)-N(7))-methyltransferase n=1 Tax=Marinomonas posidonica (strain CECT 7376 / NCIMB 14433 / IVIA-Po-181) TaxID=491952 RepID=F6CSU1_MARPP|nr:bifunctional cobalt-precorrin-7 (C(5))-methyltransferase/cobalt-precorrin-6B (C(15))-methyltransferase [Marinomonas posidonica]AEF53931.1 precorrin-6y C5,15-methyltransferase (decarboxylating), CbiE subunit [Marinomonas posidonica IVIA-Po-181]